ncbi:MAG: gamma-glutamyl-gamma-aminobutyrate hydrolase family protein [Defluviitaleaceae bacterium]|nr:gamma-glutamyl-gamma-aminobutyrate hydrolase family protein [Defluviitaleaceae bacterium]
MLGSKPIIGITASINDKQHYLNRAYVDAVERAGGLPLILPASDNIIQAIDIIDGLLLSGGGDIDGSFFDEPTHPRANDIWKQRDKAEIALTQLAYERNIPILGICRGLQILHVALGGKIAQHIEGHKQDEPRHIATHSVHLIGRPAQVVGKENIMVNSIHHQAVLMGEPCSPLRVCAVSNDGVIEALCGESARFVFGVQWHPEELIHMQEHFRIFEEFMVSILAK